MTRTAGYEWDGSYVSVRGTLQPMDDETRQLWEDYFIDAGFSYDDIGLFDDCTALPLVLTDGEIDGQDTFVYGFMGVIGVLLVVLAIWFVVHSLTGGFQKQIRNYIKASDDPQATEQALDRFYEDTMQDFRPGSRYADARDYSLTAGRRSFHSLYSASRFCRGALFCLVVHTR